MLFRSVESTEKADNDEKEANTDRAADNGGKEANVDHAPEGIPEDNGKDASLHESVQKDRRGLQERRMTVAEAETTPEALKVKRAKAHAAYKANQAELPKSVIDMKN